jgi:hypothetical protein
LSAPCTPLLEPFAGAIGCELLYPLILFVT